MNKSKNKSIKILLLLGILIMVIGAGIFLTAFLSYTVHFITGSQIKQLLILSICLLIIVSTIITAIALR